MFPKNWGEPGRICAIEGRTKEAAGDYRQVATEFRAAVHRFWVPRENLRRARRKRPSDSVGWKTLRRAFVRCSLYGKIQSTTPSAPIRVFRICSIALAPPVIIAHRETSRWSGDDCAEKPAVRKPLEPARERRAISRLVGSFARSVRNPPVSCRLTRGLNPETAF
jgi:hypothetical protein